MHEELPLFLQKSDIYISTVITDGVSASLLEAMSCGVFPIVTNNASNRLWIQDNINGYLVDYGDHEGLAKKIISAFENYKLREFAGKMNRSTILDRASIDVNMKIFENAWSKLLDRSSKNNDSK